jgi:hypothetical protein
MKKLITVVLFFAFSAGAADGASLTIKYKDGTSQQVQLNGHPSQINQITIEDQGTVSSGGGINVVAGSYGLNCGAPHGNKTDHLAQQCNGKTRCDYKIEYQVIGDPAVGCGKEYVAEWRCGDGGMKSVKAQAEAGFGSVITLSCP